MSNPDKINLRRILKQKRELISSQRRLEASEAAKQLLLTYCADVSLVLSYVSFNNELDLSPINNHLIREKKLALPGMIGNEIVLYQVLDMKNLQKHRLGFLQPDPNKCPLIANSLVQLAFIPGLGFDKSNKNRLGYGQGHYDCFLPHLEKAKLFGVGFEEQEIHSFPIEEHDIAMHEVYLF